MAKDWTGYKRYRPEWYDSQPVRAVVRSLLEGEVLAFPSGRSPLGDVTADADRAVDADVLADLRAVPFQPNSFDTVYCDPPYELYHGSQDWVRDLWAVARKRLVLQTPMCRVMLSGVTKEYHLVEPAPGSAKRWLRTILVITPANHTLG
jgi:hypothetical protein